VAVSPGPENPKPERDARDGFIDRVRAAQKKMAAAIARAGLRNDAYGEVIAAQSDTLDILVETALLSTPSLSAEDVRKLNRAAGQNAAQEVVYAVRQLAVRTYWRTLALCAGAGVLFGGAMFWAGAHWRPAPDITGMQCQDQPDRSRVCWVVVTQAPPPKTTGKQ
jgi:hypothetical protein